MDAVDGNAVAGALSELFGREMTTVIGTCKHCGSARQVAELRVYTRAPGSVMRCPDCGEVVVVLTTIRDELRISHDRFTLHLDAAS